MVEKFRVFHHFFKITNLLLTSKESLTLSLFPLIIDKSFSDVDFSIENIKNISKSDSEKAHGNDMISILTLREKCPNTEFFLVHILPHSD